MEYLLVEIIVFGGLIWFIVNIINSIKRYKQEKNKTVNRNAQNIIKTDTTLDSNIELESKNKQNSHLQLFSKIATEYNLHIELDFEIIELIYSYVEKVCDKFELDNFVNIDREKLYNLFIEYCHEEISKMKTIAQVQNRHFGLMGITLISCIIITDNAYNSLKNEESLWEDAKSAFVEDVDDILKEDFLKIMDKCYINLSLNIL